MDTIIGFQYFKHSLLFQYDAGSVPYRDYVRELASGGRVSVKLKFKDGINMSPGRHRTLRDWFFIQHGPITFSTME